MINSHAPQGLVRPYALALAALLLAASLLAGSPAQAAAPQITRVPPGQGEVALLFNADYFRGRISDILTILREHDTRLTFFLTGGYLDRYPGEVRSIAAAGQEVASHGYEHSDYRELSSVAIGRQLSRWQERFKQLTGKRGPAFWQAPYGYSNDRVRQAGLDRGYQHIYWTLDSLDAVGRPKSRSFILNRVLATSWVELNGAIILMHVNSDGTVDALEEILHTLERRGLQAVTVSELLSR